VRLRPQRLLMASLTDDSLPVLDWAAWPTRFSIFTGKGGVGKTTTASTAAVALADAGLSTLLVSTDPASNLGDLFGIQQAGAPVAVDGCPGLSVMNVDPEQAAHAFRERAIAPYRGVLPDAALANMEEQLSGACTVEVAAFEQFTDVIDQHAQQARFDRILFDTAPTGHTLRLLALPSAWSGYVEEHPAGASCLGPLAGLERQREQFARTVAVLSDPAQTALVLVTRADHSALTEAARASAELADLGIANQRLVINGLLADPGDDRLAVAFSARQTAVIADAPDSLRALDTRRVNLVAGDVTGLDQIRALAAGTTLAADDRAAAPGVAIAAIGDLVDDLDRAGSGVVMTMGKGGVGKTTLAAALAVALADRGHDVVLSTTDPAAHVAGALAGDAVGRLSIERIDPAAETERYSAEVLSAAGDLDAEGRRLLAEDLRSPCTEEIAVFRAFARTVEQASDRIVVLDTAPTGHTLLLLDAADRYQREIQRTGADVPDEVRLLAQRLRDPDYARLLLVTLAESTPVAEAARLQDDVRRAGIEPHGWIINARLADHDTTHPVLQTRANAEARHAARVADLAEGRVWGIDWQADTPRGARSLRALVAPAVAA